LGNALGKVLHDNPDLVQAGLGLRSFPLFSEANGAWLMTPGEKLALTFLLDQLRPKVAIEVGTWFGGSLELLSRYSGHVYSIDIDPEVPAKLAGRFRNVSFLTGPSDEQLPPLLARLQSEQTPLAFVLVDGDHSADAVRNDVNHLLAFRPIVPLYVLMHDSFNPLCRAGLRTAAWSSNPYVQSVELDFIPGAVFRRQL
jgi:cephalosporin hydroxylase